VEPDDVEEESVLHNVWVRWADIDTMYAMSGTFIVYIIGFIVLGGGVWAIISGRNSPASMKIHLYAGPFEVPFHEDDKDPSTVLEVQPAVFAGSALVVVGITILVVTLAL